MSESAGSQWPPFQQVALDRRGAVGGGHAKAGFLLNASAKSAALLPAYMRDLQARLPRVRCTAPAHPPFARPVRGCVPAG